MNENIKLILKLIWGVVLIYWTISGLRAKKVEKQESLITRFFQYWFPLIIAVLLMGPGEWYGHSFFHEAFLIHSNLIGIIGLVFCLVGGCISIGARYMLGKNWSLSIQKKTDHELIQNGVYKIVRHPIYTGLLLMFTGNAVIIGEYRVFPALVIIFLSFWFKIKKEEKLMISVFGHQYMEYKKRTKALIPYLV